MLLSIIGASIFVAVSIYIGPSRLLTALKDANPLWILVTLVLDVFFYILKAARWRRILQNMGVQTPYRMVLNATFIGYLANMLLPLRLGELGRAYTLRRTCRTPLGLVILSIVIEGLFDTIGIGCILGLSLLLIAKAYALNATVLNALKLLGIGSIILTLLLLVAPRIALIKRGLIRLVELPPEWLRSRLKPLLLNYLSSLAGLSRSKLELAVIWSLSIAMWLVPGLYTATFFKAFNADIPLSKALLASMLLQLSFAMPAPPAYAGTFEAYWILIYKLLGYEIVETLPIGVAYHLFNLVTAAALGGAAIPYSHLTLKETLTIKTLKPE